MEGATVFAFWGVCWCLGPRRAAAFGAWLFARIGPLSQKQRHLQRNLEIVRSPPPTTADRRDSQAIDAEASWANFGRVLAEYPHLGSLAANLQVIVAPQSMGLLSSPAVFVTAHMANWELGAAALSASGVQLTAIYAPQDNPLLDRYIQNRRAALGCRFIDKSAAVRGMLRALQDGRALGLLPDQRVDSGRPLVFFGQRAHTTIAAARIARCDMICRTFPSARCVVPMAATKYA